ncbi:uncharacterized protein METZ01_LOCUS27322 [marine metagenome]|uniref:SSD domain-containing protein n=1 Tax=marine metagenome TaxID=408172 RepID=A0A381Q6B3_9ZZZZ
MYKMISWWARNPKAANLLMVSIIIVGIATFARVEQEVFPKISPPVVSIHYTWPGASPREIEDQILVRVEESLRDIEGVDKISGFARENFGGIYVQAFTGNNLDYLLQEVKREVDAIVSLPNDVEPPVVSDASFDFPLVMVAIYGDVPEKLLTRTAQSLRDEASLLEHVDVVNVLGNRKEEISIELSETAMRRYGLTFDQVAIAIRKSSINFSSGNIKGENGTLQLSTRNLGDNLDDFNEIIIRQTADGGKIRISDVATVIDGFEDKDRKDYYIDVETGISVPVHGIMVMSTDNMNVVKTSKAIRDWIPGAQSRLPEGINLLLWTDMSDLYKGRMSLILKAAYGGLILVFFILVAFLRPQVALWCSVGIGTAFTGALIFMPAFDISLNVISLFAFLLVIGIIVDDAVIVGENIHLEYERGRRGTDAAITGAYLVAKPVFFAVITTMIAFLPWLFLTGWQVQFVRNISLIVLFALSFSLIEAFFILPAHLSNLKPYKAKNRFSKLQKKLADGIVNFGKKRYMPVLISALERRYVAAACFFALFIIVNTLASSGFISRTLLPNVEDDEMRISIALPSGSPFSRTEQVAEQVKQAGYETIEFYKGKDNAIKGIIVILEENTLTAFINLHDPAIREASTKDVAAVYRKNIGQIPDAESFSIGTQIGRDSSEPDMSFNITTSSSDQLLVAVEDFMGKLRSYDAIYDVSSSINSAITEMQISLKPNAEKLGLTLAEVSRQLRQAYYGEEVQRLPRDGEDVRVMVHYPKKLRRSINSLTKFRIRTPDGREVPFMSLASVSQSPGITKVERVDGRKSATISAYALEDGKSQVLTDLNTNYLPSWNEKYPEVYWEFSGELEGQDDFFAEIGFLSLVAVLTMFALLTIAFRSYFLPILILSALPFGFCGAIIGHVVFGKGLSMISYWGIGAACGVVINDNLVLVDYINRIRKGGKHVLESVIEAGVVRFRPIIITSMTTFIGLMPIMFEPSVQANFLKPAVISLSFGVVLCAPVTLILVPCLMLIGEDIKQNLNNAKEAIKLRINKEITPI